MEWITFAEKCIWFGLAALGFAVIFNVPKRTMLSIYLMGAAGGITKVLLMHFLGVSVIMATLAGAIVIGLISIYAAHNKHSPPLVFSIPAVIPMVPGIFAYKMMLGLMKLSGTVPPESFEQVLSDTISSGLKVLFILMSLAGGVAIPMLITRKESAKHIRIRRINDEENSDG
ncbi:threonine/serine exporter family protein [Chitinophagaceae bacterium LB-8]|uniref:Threonine/serine exporter family protein n=1 Tax=Paraflavisolibacter caeni TaxID=2982496 RepID=A0A9X2XSV3_9BACT|nr:threonine/serine exporter family protein [Paraflavisolibacter caeni]MCU7548130.1 threonine/serine exporter family protein [Paraflavisolibacter caeni]